MSPCAIDLSPPRMSYHQWSLEIPSRTPPMSETQRETSDRELPTSESSSRAPPMTDGQKLDFVFYHLKKWKQSLGTFLTMLFEPEMASSCDPDPLESRATCARTHRAYVAQFLSGNSSTTPLTIVKMIYQHPYARPSSNYHDSQQYFVGSQGAQLYC